MAISWTVLIKNRKLSSTCRVLTLTTLMGALLVTAAVSLHLLYQPRVDNYFQQGIHSEDFLLITTGGHTLTAAGSHKERYSSLMQEEIGEYQSHRFVSWHANLPKLLRSGRLPFELTYEVEYKNSTVREIFLYSGLIEPELSVREVRLGE